MYDKLAGMTGTAVTEAEEFGDIYDLDVVEVPTNMPMVRIDDDDEVYRTADEKNDAIIELIKDAASAASRSWSAPPRSPSRRSSPRCCTSRRCRIRC